ncbi:MAG: polysaccharide biosynthesis/export family protein [Bacteroidales bacterium]|nr:polysaccharide biosynthesis/export family protein [Bacteroidales bacterium]
MRHLIYICAFLVIALLHTSCYRNIRYIVDDKTPLPHQYTDSIQDYKLKPGDIIGINLISTNQEINQMFTEGLSNQQGMASANNNRRGGYIISDSGYVLLPIFGNIQASGKTINEIRTNVQRLADSKLIDAVVTAELLNFDVYFIGASQNTKVNFNKTSVNILEAIAQMGGLNYESKRRNIIVIRKNSTGHQLYNIDVTNRNLIEATQFYLQPGDIVYVEPKRFTAFSNGLKNYSTVLSIVSSALTTYYLISRLK